MRIYEDNLIESKDSSDDEDFYNSDNKEDEYLSNSNSNINVENYINLKDKIDSFKNNISEYFKKYSDNCNFNNNNFNDIINTKLSINERSSLNYNNSLFYLIYEDDDLININKNLK